MPNAPTYEIGYAQAPNYNWWLYQDETTPELIWPQSISVYDAMRRTDAQVTSVLRAMTLPVRATPWRIDPDGASDEVTDFVADNLGLPVVGAEPKSPLRQQDRFSWAEHLRLALLMLPFGHMYFEQVYRVDPDGRARLRKLGPRMPKTIEKIDVAEDGGLISISQYWTATDRKPRPIPVDRLVAYIHEREGGNWLGSSILRPGYKNWLLKDRLLRVQAQTIERNGMGVPLYTDAEGASADQHAAGLALAKAWRSGEAAGTAIPFGATLSLVGVSGTLPDAEPAIRYHDEQLGRAVLAHFLNLGTQTGSWALGTTFADFFTLSLQSLAMQIADTATQHIVEDLVDVNWGPDEPAPRIVFDEIGSRQPATAQALVALFGVGALTPDARLEESLRQQYGLPPKQQPDTDTDEPLIEEPASDSGSPEPVLAGGVGPKGPDDDDFEVEVAALVAALADFCGEVYAAADFNPDLHPRGPGGKFRNVFGRIQRALQDWENGDSPSNVNPFEGLGFKREHLRDAAKKRGITLRRGATESEIVEALKDDVRGKRAGAKAAKSPDVGKPVRFTLTGGSVDPKLAREIEVENKIRAAYASSVTEPGGWVDLSRLRPMLGDVTKEEADKVLGALALAPGVNLEPEANQRRLSLAQQQAAVRIGGEDRHLISFEDPSPRPVPKSSTHRATKAAPTAAPDLDSLRTLAAAIREGGGEGEIVRLLHSHDLNPARLRELAAELDIDLPDGVRTRRRIQLHIASEASRRFGYGDGRLAERAPKPATTQSFDADEVAERVAREGNEAADILAGLEGLPTSDLRKVATALNLPLPRDRKMSADDIRQYIAENIIRDRTRWMIGTSRPLPRTATPDLASLDTEARRDALDLRKVDELKALLREQGLPVSGKKRDLVDRLVTHLDGGGTSAAKAPAAKRLTKEDLWVMTGPEIEQAVADGRVSHTQAIQALESSIQATRNSLAVRLGNNPIESLDAPDGDTGHVGQVLTSMRAQRDAIRRDEAALARLRAAGPVRRQKSPASGPEGGSTSWSEPRSGDAALAAPPMKLADMGDDPRAEALWYRSGDNSLETETGHAGAFDMADQLRTRRLDPAMKARVAAIDSVMKESPLPGPIEVYRGIDLESVFRDWENVVGKQFTDRSFVSTTTDAEHASDFGGAVMRIQVPAGTRAIRMADRGGTAFDERESEILLDRGLRFRVIRHYGRGELKGPWGGAHVLDVEIVP